MRSGLIFLPVANRALTSSARAQGINADSRKVSVVIVCLAGLSSELKPSCLSSLESQGS